MHSNVIHTNNNTLINLKMLFNFYSYQNDKHVTCFLIYLSFQVLLTLWVLWNEPNWRWRSTMQWLVSWRT